MCHYLPIVELIVELGPEEQEDWTFGSLVYEEEKYSIGIPTVLYKELLPIAEGKEENLLEKLLEKTSQEKVTYSSSNKKIATVSSSGVITGKKKGTAYITVKSGKIRKKVKVVVK